MALVFRAILLTACASLMLQAADINGTVLVEKKLTRRNVTPNSPSYARGVAVDLNSPGAVDALAFERTHVVIYIEGKGPAGDPVTAQIEQKERSFVPDLLVVPAGATVSFPNMDAIFHNVFSLSKPKTFDLGNYSKGQTKTVTFPNPGIVFVYCHLHTNMAATIMITPNQWSTVPDAQGHFKLSGVPPGKYTVVAWHKAAGTFKQTINITGDRTAPIQFLIPFTDDQPGQSVAKR